MIFFVLLYFGQYRGAGKKYANGIKNYKYLDGGLRRGYLYTVASEKEVLEKLSHKNAGDKLNYEFDSSKSEIWFTNPETTLYDAKENGTGYKLEFQHSGQQVILYVEQIHRILPRSASAVPVLMNAFWCEKTGAKPCKVP